MRFSELTSAQRVSATLDAGSLEPVGPCGSLVLARGRIEARNVWIAATDPATARGAIGVAEARGMSELLARARDEMVPVVLLLDSSGARVDEGLPALGAFRGLLREMLLARLARLPMLAVVGRVCFGGASLLACACSRRHYLAGARFAASGPAVVEGAVGADRFNARDRSSVDALMGSAARLRVDAQAALVEDAVEPVGKAVRGWVRSAGVNEDAWSPHTEHDVLEARLLEAGLAASHSGATIANPERLAAILPASYQPRVAAESFCALPPAGSHGAAFLGSLSGAPVGAATCWQLAEWLLALHRANPDSPIVLVLDADGHAATVADEQVLLSAYLMHLSLTLAWLRAAGHRIVLWIPGRASGASYVTFAAPVETVSALPSAQIEILPAAAVKQILKTEGSAPATAAALLDAGVADGLLDRRLHAYADIAVGKP